MLRQIGLVCALALTLGGCVPSGDEVEFGENSPMLAIQNEGTLIVALPPDAAPFASQNDAGEPEGFLVDFGHEFAEALEVEVDFVFLPSTDMGDEVGGDNPDRKEIGDETVHVAFPLYRVTEQLYKQTSREHGYDVTTPYFVGHQRILAPDSAGIETTEDLAGKKVCQVVDGIAGIPADKLQPEAEVEQATEPTQCLEDLVDERVEAVVGLEPELLQILADIEQDGGSSFSITGEQATTAGYSPFVVRGMAAFASDVFNDMREDGRWAETYNEWIAPLSGEEVEAAPGMTLEEAAAIYPIEFSGDESGD